jgi:hypothetical protein
MDIKLSTTANKGFIIHRIGFMCWYSLGSFYSINTGWR